MSLVIVEPDMYVIRLSGLGMMSASWSVDKCWASAQRVPCVLLAAHTKATGYVGGLLHDE